jgi:hypothetical protein
VSVFLILSNADAKSKRPSPRPGEDRQPQQSQAQAPQQPPAADHRGTEESPLIVRSVKSKDDTAQDAEDRKDKTANDRETIAINRNLVVIGLLQLVVFVGQLLVFGYQAWKLRQTVQAASEQSRDMKASIDLARAEFISTHRPLMKVKFIDLVEVDGEQAGVRFTVVNTGQTDAHVIGSCAKADVFSETDWLHPNEYGRDNTIPPRRFVSGATDTYTIHTVNPISFPSLHVGDESGLRFYGYIVYRDESENVRTTYFCRQYNPKFDRFDPVDRPDYDSAD